jgi:lysophospholipase L1-like esterase
LAGEGWDPVVQAQAGTTIEDWSDQIQKAVDFGHPQVVVIELGTNDCGTVACVNLDPYIDGLMQHLTFADAVLWLTVQDDTIIPDNPGFVNAAIKSASSRWSNLFIVDMATYFHGHDEWRSDGTHPNAEGQRQMASLIANALEPFRPQAQ